MDTTTRIPPIAPTAIGWALRLAGAACGVWALIGCSASDESTRAGDLGRGRFKYACVSTLGDDVACPLNTNETYQFPSSIAVGGSFKLSYEPKSTFSDQIGNPVLKPASDEFLNDASPGLFLALKPGRVAIVARSSSNGRAADLTYLRIAAPSEVRVRAENGLASASEIRLPLGNDVTLRAEAYSGSGTAKDLLAGTVAFTWSTSDETVVKLDSANPASRAKLVPVKAGIANVVAKLDTLTATIKVVVP